MAQGGRPTSTQDPLAALRDIHLPATLEAWPPAPGWWVLAIIGIGASLFALYWLWHRWRQNAYRRTAIRQLGQLLTELEQHGDSRQYLEDYQHLLKRVALACFGRSQVANLTGETWVAFLDQSATTNEFSMGAGQVLVSGNYQQDFTLENDQLLELHTLGKHWIRKHKVQTISPHETRELTA